jgi:hypothetical protein
VFNSPRLREQGGKATKERRVIDRVELAPR